MKLKLERKEEMNKRVNLYTRTAIPGSMIAWLLSYSVNSSLLWGLVHGALGWIYVTYWLLNNTDICAWIRTWVV